jgi:hypothetical protein
MQYTAVADVRIGSKDLLQTPGVHDGVEVHVGVPLRVQQPSGVDHAAGPITVHPEGVLARIQLDALAKAAEDYYRTVFCGPGARLFDIRNVGSVKIEGGAYPRQPKAYMLPLVDEPNISTREGAPDTPVDERQNILSSSLWGASTVRPQTADQTIAAIGPIAFSAYSLFRGEPAIYPGHVAKIARFSKFSVPDTLQLESYMFRGFRSRGAHFLSLPEYDLTKKNHSCLSIMQHYGAPTRLLDWSRSAWIALYFACQSDLSQPGVVYGFDTNALDAHLPAAGFNQNSTGAFGNAWHSQRAVDWLGMADAGKIFMWFGPQVVDDRMANQQAQFTVSNPADEDHAAVIGRVVPSDRRWAIVIPAAIKPALMDLLRSMNITSARLFPGKDGIGRHLTDILQFRLVEPFPNDY